jgi:hypothetical protein
MSEKNPPKYICEICNYFTAHNKDYMRHTNTKKHINATLSNINVTEKSAYKYYCKKCNYYTRDLKDYNKHIQTKKHICNNITKEHICENCNKCYNNRTGLWRHKKICVNKQEINDNKYSDIGEINLLSQMFLEMVKQNQEFKELLMEQNKQNQNLQIQFIEMAKEKSITTNNSHNTTTNNNNNHFNLQVFLNERCKNALNMVEFIEQLNVTIHDLEETCRLGFAEGISRIFINGLKNLDVYERPIHCSDAKRETIYIKNENKWEKDDDNKSNLEKAVRKVGQKNMRCITQWQKLHPYFNDSSAKDSDKYLHMVSNSMCGGSVEETKDNYNKIKKNIIKETIIKKNE